MQPFWPPGHPPTRKKPGQELVLTDLQHIIEASKRGDELAQRYLYDLFKGRFFAMCLRYADNRADAEDMLQEGFIQVFKDLHQYRESGSFEGWARKVVLNVALQFLRRKKRDITQGRLDNWDELNYAVEEGGDFFSEDLIKTALHYFHTMPLGFRTVLNLYVIEGFSHEQIAQTLGISVGTSKSQLSRAKAYLKNMLDKSLAG